MKRSKKLLALVLALAALVGCYALAVRVGRKQDTAQTQGSYPLCEIAAQDMTALDWTYGDAHWRFVRNGSVWVNADDASFPVNQEAIDAMASRIAGLTAVRELTNADDLSVYGLQDPVLTVTAEGPDGAVTCSLGAATPFEDGYYVLVDGKDAIYTVETSFESTFDRDITQLAQMQTIPEAQDVTRIVVGETLDATLGEDGIWRDSVTGEALDGEAVSSLVDDAQSLSWSTLVAVSADDDALEGYGLGTQATRLTLYSGEKQTRTLLLGGTDEDENRYARLPDSSMVYTLYEGDVAALLAAGTDTLFDPTPIKTALDTLQTAVLSTDGAEIVLERVSKTQEQTPDEPEAQSDTEGEDEEGDAKAQPAFTLNGKSADAEAVASLWEQLTGLSATARTDEMPQGEGVLTVTLEDTLGEHQTLTLYPYDVDSYLLPVTNTHALLVPADSVDRIVRTIRQLSGS